jgi:hypothetical protein
MSACRAARANTNNQSHRTQRAIRNNEHIHTHAQHFAAPYLRAGQHEQTRIMTRQMVCKAMGPAKFGRRRTTSANFRRRRKHNIVRAIGNNGLAVGEISPTARFRRRRKQHKARRRTCERANDNTRRGSPRSLCVRESIMHKHKTFHKHTTEPRELNQDDFLKRTLTHNTTSNEQQRTSSKHDNERAYAVHKSG